MWTPQAGSLQRSIHKSQVTIDYSYKGGSDSREKQHTRLHHLIQVISNERKVSYMEAIKLTCPEDTEDSDEDSEELTEEHFEEEVSVRVSWKRRYLEPTISPERKEALNYALSKLSKEGLSANELESWNECLHNLVNLKG